MTGLMNVIKVVVVVLGFLVVCQSISRVMASDALNS